MVHSLGFRYRLHDTALPGRPDLVLPGRRKVIFVHGCFWHRHGPKCPLTRLPKSRLEFWKMKLEGNRRRDEKTVRRLRADGWGVLTIWECQVSHTEVVKARIIRFLGG